jgi:large subunit ribosomal protein L29
MKPKEIRAMTVDEIESKISDFQEKLFKQKVQKALGQTENPYKIRDTRRDIAKLKTILAEKKGEV